MQTIGEKILILPSSVEEVTKGGIIIPGNSQEKPNRGEIILVGNRCEVAKVGDTIYYSKYQNTEIDIDGIKHLVMTEKDILLIV